MCAQWQERSASNAFRYRLQAGGLTLGELFGQLEDSKAKLSLKQYLLRIIYMRYLYVEFVCKCLCIYRIYIIRCRYSVGQTTLEQIFNQFAGTQNNPENN